MAARSGTSFRLAEGGEIACESMTESVTDIWALKYSPAAGWVEVGWVRRSRGCLPFLSVTTCCLPPVLLAPFFWPSPSTLYLTCLPSPTLHVLQFKHPHSSVTRVSVSLTENFQETKSRGQLIYMLLGGQLSSFGSVGVKRVESHCVKGCHSQSCEHARLNLGGQSDCLICSHIFSFLSSLSRVAR